MIPKKVFLTHGVGRHKEELESFELALRDAGIQICNIVEVSSIFPPGAKLLTKQQGLKLIKPGQITFAVMSRLQSNEKNRLLSASIGIAIPKDKTSYGYLSEHHAFGEKECGKHAEDLAVAMLATKMGIKLDPGKHWDQTKQHWKIEKKVFKTSSITETATVKKNGE
ncbi:arginine decarboxylase, pyruvoyl-dependent, partial [Candidatus Woesearchaeota archaeon]|nr:arginine decarboxylase, pyruvoyl-dependent [Candidatus Woesearchaeota archaeon]